MPARDFIDLVLRLRRAASPTSASCRCCTPGPGPALTHYAAPGVARGGRTAAGRGRAAGAADRRAGQPAPADVGAVLRGGRATSEADSPAAARAAGGHARRSTGWRSTRSCAGRSWTPLAAHGVADESVIAAELARDDTASGKRHQVRCLAARPSAAVKAQAWAAGGRVGRAVQRAGRGDDRGLRAAVAAGAARAVRGAVLRGDRAGVGRAVDPDRDGRGEGAVPVAARTTRRRWTATDAWLAAHADAAPALRRLVLEARDDLARALRAQACDAAAAAGL